LETLFDQQYSADFSERCRNALEANFGEIPMPKSFGRRRGNVTVEPVYIVEVIQKTKLVNKRRVNNNRKGKKRNLVIKINTRIKI
jgi:hypothetical protein